MHASSKRSRVALGVILALVLPFAAAYFFEPHNKSSDSLPTGSGTPAVAIGDNHGVILASDGSLWTWGEPKSLRDWRKTRRS